MKEFKKKKQIIDAQTLDKDADIADVLPTTALYWVEESEMKNNIPIKNVPIKKKKNDN
jgi:hypothetical protein